MAVSFRVARVQPCHSARGSIKALRGCLRTSRETANLWVSQKRTSAAEAVKHRRFTARLKPCPSYRDAFSFSFLVVAPRQEFVQNAPAQLRSVKHVCRALRSTASSPRLRAPKFSRPRSTSSGQALRDSFCNRFSHTHFNP